MPAMNVQSYRTVVLVALGYSLAAAASEVENIPAVPAMGTHSNVSSEMHRHVPVLLSPKQRITKFNSACICNYLQRRTSVRLACVVPRGNSVLGPWAAFNQCKCISGKSLFGTSTTGSFSCWWQRATRNGAVTFAFVGSQQLTYDPDTLWAAAFRCEGIDFVCRTDRPRETN